MPHPKMLNRENTVLVVVDIQEAFRGAISEFSNIAAQTAIAVRGFQILDLPVIVTEQYPKGLGKTAREIVEVLPEDFEFVEKTAFSSRGSDAFLEKLKQSGAKQIVLAGLETHICVNQTAHDLLNENFEVHVLQDCVASRSAQNKATALQKLHANGVIPSCVEMALFELMRDAKHEKFKEIQKLVK
jgi:nicotinamidase-related amidase